jgi:hypothetical protein
MLMVLMRKLLAVQVLVLALVLGGVAPLAGCGGEKTLAQAAEAAKDIGGGTRDVIKAVGEAYQKGLLTLAQKDRLAALLKAIAKGGEKGIDAIEALQKTQASTLTSDQRQQLTRIFDDEVVTPFLQLLQELGTLSGDASVAIRAALVSVRTAIVLLSSRIGRADTIKAIEAREVWNV